MKAVLILSLAALSLGLSSCANCCKKKTASECSSCSSCEMKKK
ncbi:hypothetical protein SAMN02745166_02716 [Prosthecobacter debontii]|uniref:Virus attachment protein p12 family protein n=1 Tax=Prosthecobacter debontii TaxID=48467 RepID=A0A1T4YAH5_9BACT|nr:hypothetical protein SAMN02745166_02716 [Prosthecobacter debontii]